MLRLRLIDEGVSANGFYEKFGLDLLDVFGKQVTDLLHQGLIQWNEGEGSTLVLTERGIMLGKPGIYAVRGGLEYVHFCAASIRFDSIGRADRCRPLEDPLCLFGAHIDTTVRHHHAEIIVPPGTVEGYSIFYKE